MPKKPRIYNERYDWRGRKVIETIDADGNISTIIQDSHKEKDGPNNHRHHWYQKPVGVVALSVLAGLILWGIVAILRSHFPDLFTT
jgi:hypothetical protein